ncbi:hypothetical protein [Brucella anthropi]|uniref:hypothetical protein n=1 Tax=Brucella anthropi TaxID=529 RepID=UPI001CFED0AA|nr:hypothetical protein [Brucella anthropi]
MTSDLITRLSKLDAPDREVDAEIAVALDLFETRPNKGWPDRIDYGSRNSDGSVTWPGHGFDQLIPRYTASVDAAIALAERLFPGTEYEFTNLYNIVRVTIEMNGEYGGFHGEHVNSLPIAILIALLRAKEASNG